MNIFKFFVLGLFFSSTFLHTSAQFVEVGNQVGLDLGDRKDGGASWGDFNGDGCPDMLVNTNSNSGASHIFMSDCNLVTGPTFTDVTSTHAAGLLNALTERSAIWADFTNDGYLDFARNGNDRFELYINKGPAATPAFSFGDALQNPNLVITNIAGGMNTEGFGWMDYNGDGWVDLLIENHNYGIDIFQNPANGTANFFHVTPNGSSKGLPTGAKTGDYMCLGDYNDDGYVDILARKEDDFDIWQNNGPLAATQFQPVTSFNENANNGNKGGVLFADFNNDGLFDLFWSDRGDNQIFLQTIGGTFAPTGEPVASSGITLPSNGIDGCAAADVNNDGKTDLFLSDNSGASFLFLNNTPYGGALDFTRNNLGINVNADGEGIAFADYDLDGDLDLYVNVNNGNNQLWKNGNNNENFLFVRALRDVGGGVLRDDIGATVVLKDCFGNVRSGIRDVNGTRGHGSQDFARIHFGLPDGSASTYVVEINFTYANGTRKTVRKSIVPDNLPSHELTVTTNDVTDTSLCAILDAAGIVAFQATPAGNGIALKWTLNSMETGSDYQIERSEDAQAFASIGEEPGLPGNLEAYRFTDQLPLEGRSYYRIRRQQTNGDVAYSEVLVYEHSIENSLTLLQHPVPAGQNIEFQVNAASSEDLMVQVFDVTGKLVLSRALSVETGVNRLSLERDQLTRGIFLFQVNGKGFNLQQKLILR